MRKHEEQDLLHIPFCRWVKKTYPGDTFLRHEREGKRTPFMQNLFSIMNNGIDKLPDFEALIGNGFYLEFKKPGEKWLLKDGKTVKPQYANQYRNHKVLWSMGRAVWFCNDLDNAKCLYNAFKQGYIHDQQVYELPLTDMDRAQKSAEEFFNRV